MRDKIPVESPESRRRKKSKLQYNHFINIVYKCKHRDVYNIQTYSKTNTLQVNKLTGNSVIIDDPLDVLCYIINICFPSKIPSKLLDGPAVEMIMTPGVSR